MTTASTQVILIEISNKLILEAGSFVGGKQGDQTFSIHDSSMHEMSAIDIKREMSNRTMVEKGAIGGGAGGNREENNDEDNGGMLFETPPNDGQLNSSTPRPLRKTFSRSMAK